MSRLIIAIDGPAASGKTTVARRVADLLGYTYLDSGAMYRAVAWKALRDGVPLDSPGRLEALARGSRIDLVRMGPALHVMMDSEDITERIRSTAVAQAASQVAMIPGVRAVLVAQQRRAGEAGGVVMEGRDIGTRGVSRRGSEDFSGCLGGSARRAAAAGTFGQRRAI